MPATVKPPSWRCARCLRQPPYVRREGLRPTCRRCRDELASKGLKWCCGCHRPQPLALFGVVRQGDRRRSRCEPCYRPLKRAIDARRFREWRAANLEAARERARAYRAAHREEQPEKDRMRRVRAKLRILRGER